MEGTATKPEGKYSTENSKQDMIGKKVGIFHDVRLKEAKAYGAVSYDPGGLDHKSIQALLEYSSGDATRAGQKHIRAWVGKPLIKITLISNRVPNFRDQVLPDRFIMLDFKKSNLGKEDHNLKTRTLPAEISGIAYRCLAAYRRLLERDRFIQPKSALKLLTSVREIGNPFLAFMNAYWEPGEQGVSVKVFNAVFRYWAKKESRLDLWNTNASNVIQSINEIKEWEHLHSFRRNSEPRKYAVKFKPGAVTEEMPETIKIDGRPVPELVEELETSRNRRRSGGSA